MKIIIIGGGAAGMMAAMAAAESGASVWLIEKNEKLGKKLFITGKGRCNVTNAGDMETLLANVCTNSKFLYSAFYDFDNRAVMRFLEQEGCPLKTERGERVFPVSDHSSDVIGAFQRALKRLGVKVLLNTEVKDLALCREDGAESIAGVELQDGRVLPADRCIICTGGMSYPATGSTGDGYRFAERTGHRLTPCSPSLVPFNIREEWCRRLTGLTLKNVSVRLCCRGREVYEGFGEMLFTHFGVSGPLILSASSFMGQKGKKSGKDTETEETRLFVDLKPALDEEQLDRRLLRDFEENKNKQFKNALGGLFPVKLIPVMRDLSGIHPDKKVNEVTREERRRFVKLIKNLPLTVTGLRGYEEAVITKGGICVKDINPSSMESKKVRGLYFAGEVLDLDALTGGFNLQIAWSTGHLAGKCARNTGE
ncbi:MAG: NAD(P)/FAD-dependent oxidoreductase [Lachnospiraceae bacterium]|jgi:predicted Rossmann fold flavoprotein|nr:NAD(P)/FAD-dependent oxidoreductase [uncultured Acetatifactor sp.]MCI9220569.1 NAD(P)/FAD-dependent oxidoreductase [Lachnospiraceae bacterium]